MADSLPDQGARNRLSWLRDALGDVVCLVVVGAVPLLLTHRIACLAVVAVGAVVFAAIDQRITGRGIVLVAYGVPVLAALPWPAHCLSAGFVWAVLHREQIRASLAGQVRPALWAFPVFVVLGVASAAVAVLIDHDRVIDQGLNMPFPQPGVAVLTAGVIGLAVFNSTAEELMWRGVLAGSVSTESGPHRRAVLQATSFGAAHWYGIPSGPWGVLTAGLFSAILYRIRVRYGIAPAVLVHFVADLTIFSIAARYATFDGSGFTVTHTL